MINELKNMYGKINTKEDVENYYNITSYNYDLKELWEDGEKKYFAVRELGPMGQVEYNEIIYIRRGILFNNKGLDIVKTALEYL